MTSQCTTTTSYSANGIRKINYPCDIFTNYQFSNNVKVDILVCTGFQKIAKKITYNAHSLD